MRNLTKRQRWTEKEWEEVESAAKREGATPCDFVRRSSILAARAGLKEMGADK